MTLKYYGTVLGMMLWTASLLAQRNIEHQNLYWMRYYNQLSFNQRWIWHNELDDRRFFKNNQQQHLILHSRLYYKISKSLELAAGFTYSLQGPQHPEHSSALTVPENRIVQELNHTHPLNHRFSLVHRFRIDERFIHKNNGQELIPGYDFNFRFRYRLGIHYGLDKDQTMHPTILKLSDEVMINAGPHIVYNTFDQNRISFSAEHQFSPAISVELGYMHWYQQRSSGYQFYSRDILRFTFYHRISLIQAL